jgi:hypothetical protein
MTRTFMITRYEEGGPKATDNSVRLVCLTETNELIAIWGSAGDQGNINIVMSAGLPCEIECETREPSAWARDRGHDYWVPQGAKLRTILARVSGRID